MINNGNPLMQFIQPQPQQQVPQNNGGFNMNSLMQFMNTYGNNPQAAQQEVQQLLNNGQMSQEQFNKFQQQAPQIMQMLGGLFGGK